MTNTSPTAGRLPVAQSRVRYKNLIKDRRERSGMRWTEQMAEAIQSSHTRIDFILRFGETT